MANQREAALLPTPADLEGWCVVCGRVTVFIVALLPGASFIACRRGAPPLAGTLPAMLRSGVQQGLCWWCWGRGWSLVRPSRRLS